MNINLDDPKLTAYVLGELDADAASEIEVLAEQDSDVRRYIDEIRSTAELLSAELHAEPAPSPALRPVQHQRIEKSLHQQPGHLRRIFPFAAAATIVFGLGWATHSMVTDAARQNSTKSRLASANQPANIDSYLKEAEELSRQLAKSDAAIAALKEKGTGLRRDLDKANSDAKSRPTDELDRLITEWDRNQKKSQAEQEQFERSKARYEAVMAELKQAQMQMGSLAAYGDDASDIKKALETLAEKQVDPNVKVYPVADLVTPTQSSSESSRTRRRVGEEARGRYGRSTAGDNRGGYPGPVPRQKMLELSVKQSEIAAGEKTDQLFSRSSKKATSTLSAPTASSTSPVAQAARSKDFRAARPTPSPPQPEGKVGHTVDGLRPDYDTNQIGPKAKDLSDSLAMLRTQPVDESKPAPAPAADPGSSTAPAANPEPAAEPAAELAQKVDMGFEVKQIVAGVKSEGLEVALAEAAPASGPVKQRLVWRDQAGKAVWNIDLQRGESLERALQRGERERQVHNTESYDHRDDNPFLSVTQNPLSTFSIDVDTASYSNVRRFLNRNTIPPKDAVRIEEMINYFRYDYPAPEGEHPFSANMEVTSCPWEPAHRVLRVGLQGKPIANEDRPSSNLVFLLDVSGSMSPANKLPLLKNAFRLLVDQLSENDRVAIVVYAGASGLVLPSTSGDNKSTILDALERLKAGGSTNGASGIQLAYDMAVQNYIEGGVNRVILATDGDFNVGVTNRGDLIRLIEDKAKSGVFLSVLGFGAGNLKDATMEQLADKGNGNYSYIDNEKEARKVLVEQVGGTLVTIAKDVKIQIEFNPAEISAYRLVGYENRMLAAEDFNDDTKDAGEIGAGHSVTALYELVPAGKKADVADVDPLKYQRTSRLTKEARSSGELLTLKLRYKQPDGDKSRLIEQPVTDAGKDYRRASADTKFALAVASFGMLLRDASAKGNTTFASVLELAEEVVDERSDEYRREFLTLVKKARKLNKG